MLGVIKHHLKIFIKFIQFSFIQHFAFRFNFYGYLIDIGWLLFSIAFIKIFYLNVPEIVGWNYWEMLVLLGVFWIFQALIYGLVVIGNCRKIPQLVWTGELDGILLKPINSQFNVSLRIIWTPIFLNIIPAIWFIYLGFSGLKQPADLINVFCFILMSVFGFLIAYGLWFIITIFVFFLERADNLPYLPQAVIDNVSQYPIDIFKGKTKFIFIWFIPLAFVVSFPTQVLLGQLSKIYVIYAGWLAIIILYLSSLFWNFALKHYSSASS